MDHVHVYLPKNEYLQRNKTIIGKTSQAKSFYSRPDKKENTHTHRLQTPSKKLGKINTLDTVR